MTIRISRAGAGSWSMNGDRVSAVDGCVDVDLGFTPATNLLPIRRLRLGVGEAAEAPAAWLSVPSASIKRLPQSYRRVAKDRYAYEAPSVGYAGTLVTSREGAVVLYPGLFELVTPRGAAP